VIRTGVNGVPKLRAAAARSGVPPAATIAARRFMRTVYSCRIPPFELGDRAIANLSLLCVPRLKSSTMASSNGW
jgi:hypothetical protein